MPNKRAAYKALRSDVKKREKNISTKSRIKTLTKKVINLAASKNKTEIEKSLKVLISAIDKASQKGIIHKKTASRKIARLSKRAAKSLK